MNLVKLAVFDYATQTIDYGRGVPQRRRAGLVLSLSKYAHPTILECPPLLTLHLLRGLAYNIDFSQIYYLFVKYLYV